MVTILTVMEAVDALTVAAATVSCLGTQGYVECTVITMDNNILLYSCWILNVLSEIQLTGQCPDITIISRETQF